MIAEVLIACTLSSPLLPADLDIYQDCKKHNEIIYHMEDYVDLFHEYFTDPNDLGRILRIAFCESSGNPNAYNENKDGSNDLGILQFNDRTWWDWLAPKLKITSERTNVRVSVAVASWLIRNDTINKYGHGWYHWYPSRSCWDLDNI